MRQLTLFTPETPVAPPVSRHYKYARSSSLIACPVIEAELIEIFRSQPADWLDWPAFRPVIDKHGVGFVLGHKLGLMARHGLIEKKEIYRGSGIGAERPGSPNYQGFRVEYRLAPVAPQRTA